MISAAFWQAAADFQVLLDDPEINVVDIVLPPFLHTRFAIEAMNVLVFLARMISAAFWMGGA